MNSRNRPTRQWYARMITDTLDDDFVIGPAAFSAINKESNEAPLTVTSKFLGDYRRRVDQRARRKEWSNR